MASYTDLVAKSGIGVSALATSIGKVLANAGTGTSAMVAEIARYTAGSGIGTSSIVEVLHAQNVVSASGIGVGGPPINTLAQNVVGAGVGTAAINQRVAQSVVSAGLGASATQITFNPVNLVAAQGVGVSALRQEFFTNVSASGFGTGLCFGVKVASDLVVSAGIGLGDPVHGGTYYSMVSAVGHGASASSQNLSGFNLVVSDGFGESELIDPYHGDGWSALPESWGMSRYLGTDFNSLASVNGTLYAAREDGLYAMQAPAREGPAAALDFGVTELDLSFLCRLSDAYLTHSAQGKMALVVGDMAEGKEEPWRYETDRNLWPVVAPDRISLGSGHRARFFRFTLKNQTGADFAWRNLRILYDITSRRF